MDKPTYISDDEWKDFLIYAIEWQNKKKKRDKIKNYIKNIIVKKVKKG